MEKMVASNVCSRQDPLRERYRTAPAEALITDCACTLYDADRDAFHGQVMPGGHRREAVFDFGIHEAVGGYHDQANPGDLLCAALASCLDSTLRMIAERMEIEVQDLKVDVRAKVDVRGTLAVNRDVPVGFRSMHCGLFLQVAPGTPGRAVDRLLEATERSCVVLQTLRAGVAVETELVDSLADPH